MLLEEHPHRHEWGTSEAGDALYHHCGVYLVRHERERWASMALWTGGERDVGSEDM